MSTFISYYKVTENKDGTIELASVTLAGVAQEGIVLNAGKLNNELSDAIQHFYNLSWISKRDNAKKAYNALSTKNEYNKAVASELLDTIEYYNEIIQLLEENTSSGLSTYVFINRLALAILNVKNFRVSGENALYNALKISGAGDNVANSDLSKTRTEIIPILAEMLDVKGCDYVKPVNIKLNLREISQLIAIANNSRTRWTNKGIKTKYSKTIETEVALQSILFVCRNAFKMVIPVKSNKDDRETI